MFQKAYLFVIRALAFFMKNAQILIQTFGEYTLSDRKGFFKYELYIEELVKI